MSRWLFVTLVALAFANSSSAAEPAATPAEKYNALVKEFDEVGGARQLAEQFFELAEQHPADPAAVDSLLWIVANLRTRPEAKRSLELLTKRHANSERLAAGCGPIARVPAVEAEQLLSTCLESSPHPAVQAAACLHLARMLEQQAEVVEQLKKQPELTERILEYYGKEYGQHLAALSQDKLAEKIEQTYQRMKKSFADATVQDTPLGPFAERALFRIQHLSIGTVAPDIEGEDIDGKPFKLSGYRGKVVMLSFWGHW